MAKVVLETTDNRYISGTPNWLVVALLGLLIGVGVWGFSWVTERFIIDPILCRDMTLQACGNVTSVAGNIAAIIGACVGLGLLLRRDVRRPVIIVAAVLVTFWGLAGWIEGLSWLESLGWTAVLYALAYVAFTWLTRPRSLVVALLITAVVVAAARVAVTF